MCITSAKWKVRRWSGLKVEKDECCCPATDVSGELFKPSVIQQRGRRGREVEARRVWGGERVDWCVTGAAQEDPSTDSPPQNLSQDGECVHYRPHCLSTRQSGCRVVGLSWRKNDCFSSPTKVSSLLPVGAGGSTTDNCKSCVAGDGPVEWMLMLGTCFGGSLAPLTFQFIYLNKKIKIEIPNPIDVNALGWNQEQVGMTIGTTPPLPSRTNPAVTEVQLSVFIEATAVCSGVLTTLPFIGASRDHDGRLGCAVLSSWRHCDCAGMDCCGGWPRTAQGEWLGEH